MIRWLLVSFTLLAGLAPAGGWAQNSTFPENGAAPLTGVPCTNGLIPLREEAEKKGSLIREAANRHAPPRETCKLIGDYSAAEVRMMKYVEGNSVACDIPAGFAEQLKMGHKNTEAMLMRVCAAAEQDGRREPPGQINDFGDPAFKGRRF